MPKDAKPKSDGFSLDFSEPTGKFTLKQFCEKRGLPYGDLGVPIPAETFAAFGDAFQKGFAP